MYAKIKNNEIVKFPYDINDLQIENPYTNFGIDVNIIDAYSNTEDAITNESQLIEVFVDDLPVYDNTKQMIQYDKNNIVFENNRWVIKWIIEDLPKEIKVI